jgi:hypothetical protein
MQELDAVAQGKRELGPLWNRLERLDRQGSVYSTDHETRLLRFEASGYPRRMAETTLSAPATTRRWRLTMSDDQNTVSARAIARAAEDAGIRASDALDLARDTHQKIEDAG